MNRSYPLVEIHYALWAVMAVPIGFAGLFYILPGLIFEIGVPLLIIAAMLIAYIAKLTQFSRAAWLFGIALHALVIAAGVYYLPRWPLLLGLPLAAANLYSLIVLFANRRLWSGSDQLRAQPA